MAIVTISQYPDISQFSSPALTILAVAGLLLLPTLLPVAVTDHSVKLTNTTSEGAFNDLDKLSMGHVGVRIFYKLSIYA